jgi:hypothetical protein
MDRTLILRRDAAADRHDAALARHPTRSGGGFAVEMKAVIRELEEVATGLDRTSTDPIEHARTLSWLANAYFDLGQGKDQALLEQAARHHQSAEDLIDPSQRGSLVAAKLAFNYANTLRGRSQGSDVSLLEAAEHRYELALKGFRRAQEGQLAATAEEYLGTLRTQLGLARAVAGGSPDPRTNKVLEHHLAQAVADAKAIAERYPERLPQAAGQFAAVLGKVEELKAMAGANQGRDEGLGAMVELLRSKVRERAQAGVITPDRAQELERLLEDAVVRLGSGGDTLEALAEKAQAARQLARVAAVFAMDPSHAQPPPPPSSRAARVAALGAGLEQHLLGAALMPSPGVTARASELFRRLAESLVVVRSAGADDARVRKLEPSIWALAREVQLFARRDHLIVARPRWPSGTVTDAPTGIFVSGGQSLRRQLETEARARGVRLMEGSSGEDQVHRWNQLRASSAGVFFLNAVPPETQPDPIGARPRLAQASYELGLALATGLAVVVVIEEGATTHFDVPVRTLALAPGGEAAQVLDAAEEVVFSTPWGGTEAGRATGPRLALEHLEQRLQVKPAGGEASIAWRMMEKELEDPVAFTDRLTRFLHMLPGQTPPEVLFPAWPPAYRRDDRARCFHVTPFRPWSEGTASVLRAGCKKMKVHYARGDESDEQRILRAVWQEVAAADFIVADLTNLNPNVALELGLAHALGKPCLHIFDASVDVDGDRARKLFPSIAKDQAHRYSSRDGHDGLSQRLVRFLGRQT